MKKLISICTLLSCMLFMGCSDDNDALVSELKVLSTTAKFDASGGEGKIEVQSPAAITAVSEEDWCTVSVSGQTVNVTVPVNETITGRTAMVVITAGDETLKVPVYQAGDIFSCDLRNHIFPMEGESWTVPLKTSCDVSVTGAPKWLKYEIRDDGIVFTVDPTSDGRSARVTVTNGLKSVTAVLMQLPVEGTYSLSFMDKDGLPQTGTAVVTKSSGNTYYVKTHGMVVDATIKMSYPKETSRMVISLGQELGKVKIDDGTYTVKLCAWTNDGFTGWDPNFQYVGDTEFDEATGKVRFEFKDNGSWPGKRIIGLFYGVFYPTGTYAKIYYGLASNLVMTQQ